jgi:4-aminobutyrate aminotransferase-like enzyme
VPVGAVIARPKIGLRFQFHMEQGSTPTRSAKRLGHGGALATLHVIEQEHLVENAAAMGQYAARLKEIAPMPFSFDVRGIDVRHRFRPSKESIKLKMAWTCFTS